MIASREEVESQEGWIKQTTIMTNKPMVVDFYATWCGPCKQLTPILDEIEKNHKGEVIFKRVDVDQEPDLAMAFRVEAIPMLLFITPKGEYQSIMGLQEPQVIEAKIADLLKRSGK
jgi:thioredoxin